MTDFVSVEVKEDAFEGSDLTLTVGLNIEGDKVCVFTDGDYEMPPVYFTPESARKLGNALHEAARIADGLPSAGLFGGDA